MTTPAQPRLPPWKTCLDFERQAADHYNDLVLTPLFDLIKGTPRRVLELGCAGGAFGAELKSRHPGAVVVGIEAGSAAAQRAATRLDRVIVGRLEDLDLAAQGFRHGEFDTVVAADVLEHLVNPWDVLERARPFLAPGAQLVASIPNVRNLSVVAPLVDGGEFQYHERGLMDITHLRFFTLRGIVRLFEETGYALEERQALILPSLEVLHRSHLGRGNVTLRLGRLVMSDVTQDELTELCAAQFLVRCRPR